MRQPISFKEFLKLPEEVKESMATFDNASLSEDLSGVAHKKAMFDLEKKLKAHDWYYSFGDHKAWKKGKKQEGEIRSLVDLIGDDGMSLYKQYGKKAGVINESNLSPSDKASIKKYMKELEKLCKRHNWHWMYEKDDSKFKHGQFAEQKIRELVIDIKELGSIEGFNLYQKYASKNGIKINYFKEAKEAGIYDYERYFHSKLKKWRIKSVDQLCPEDKKKFDDEVDRDWNGGEKVKVNMPESKSVFPEMANVVRQGTLGYGDDRRVGEKSLTADSFCDAGNLYPEHLVPQFIPPSEHRKRRMK